MFRSLACSVALAAAALLFTVATAEAQSQQYVYGNYGTVATSIFSATVGYVTVSYTHLTLPTILLV